MQRVALALPARNLAARCVHAGQPPAPDDLGSGRLLHVDDRQDMVGEALPVARGIGIAPADIPEAMQPEPVDRHEGDLARLGRLRDVVDPEAGGKRLVASGKCLGDRALEIVVGVGIALQHPDVRRIDRQQQVAVGLQVKGARIGRRRDKIDRGRPPRVAHIGDGEPVGKHVADKGVALVDHDLDAVASPVLVGMPDKLDVVRGNRCHEAPP